MAVEMKPLNLICKTYIECTCRKNPVILVVNKLKWNGSFQLFEDVNWIHDIFKWLIIHVSSIKYELLYTS